MEVAGLVAKIIREEKPVKVKHLDGLGVGLADRLEEQGYGDVINRVNFGGNWAPLFDETGKPAGGPANRRAEIWLNLKTALQGRLAIPDRRRPARRPLFSRLQIHVWRQASPRSQGGHEETRHAVTGWGGDAVALYFSELNGSPFPRSNGFNRKIEYRDDLA
jgi:hypothetical protein